MGCSGDDAEPEPPAPPQQAEVGRRAPSFVLVLTDDQAPSDLAAMPHVGDDLGAAGVTFEHAFASVPECCPSRASLLDRAARTQPWW